MPASSGTQPPSGSVISLVSENVSQPVPGIGASPVLPDTSDSRRGHETAKPDEVLRERRRAGRTRMARVNTVAINETNAALVANLGQGGMRVQALGRPVETGAKLRLQFQLPGTQETVRISSIVAWVNDTAEAGFRFSRLSRPLARRFREALARTGIANAARELLRVGGSQQAAFELVSHIARLLTGATGVALILDDEGRIHSLPDEEHPVRSTVSAPIYASQRVVGHMEISSSQLGAFDELDLSFLPVLSGLVGEMIELRAAGKRQPLPASPRLTTRIAGRIEGMLPTVRVRIVS